MKKELNNKGFTLVELLATVVILLAISMIAITSISAAMDRQNAKKDEETVKIIVSYGRLYLEEHRNSTDPNARCVTVDTLKNYYNLDPESFVQSTNNHAFNGAVKTNDDFTTFTYVSGGC